MGTYLRFRSWARSGSRAEKQLAAAAAAIVVGLLSWAVVPTVGSGPSSVAVGAAGNGPAPSMTGAAGGAQSGGAATPAPSAAAQQAASSATGPAPASGPATPGAASGTVATASSPGSGPAAVATGVTPGGGPATGAAGCGHMAASDTGVTPTEIKVADVLLNLAGAIGNSAVGAASPQIQQQMAQAVVDDINAHGGVDCRKLVVDFLQANPIDPTSTQNDCLQLQQAGVFAVIGGFAFPQGANDCLAQAKLPVVAGVSPTPAESRQYYPYLMAITADPLQDFKNAIFGMRDRGFFTAAQGFSKVAILEDDCSQELDQAVNDYLVQAGVAAGAIVRNEFSCPSSGFASPSDMGSYAAQDNLAGITDVVVVTGGGSFKEFVSAAKGQNYKPHYLVSNYQGFMVTATGGTGPDPASFDGTIATTTTRFGEETTPAVPANDATQHCIAVFAKENLPASYVLGPYQGGTNCNLFDLFVAAASHDPGPTRTGLAAGLGQVGRFDEAFPAADSIYRTPGAGTPVKVTGGDFWWTVQFEQACTCWKVIDPTEHPGY